MSREEAAPQAKIVCLLIVISYFREKDWRLHRQ